MSHGVLHINGASICSVVYVYIFSMCLQPTYAYMFEYMCIQTYIREIRYEDTSEDTHAYTALQIAHISICIRPRKMILYTQCDRYTSQVFIYARYILFDMLLCCQLLLVALCCPFTSTSSSFLATGGKECAYRCEGSSCAELCEGAAARSSTGLAG